MRARAASRAALVLASALAGYACAECPAPGQLQEALIILATANPGLIAERTLYEEQTRQHAWETTVTLGYSITDTFESGAAGPNAALRIRIPLWDRSSELKSAQARAAWKGKEDTLRTAFLADIQTLCEQSASVAALDTMRAFYRDRLKYRQEQVDQGLAEPDTLWAETEAAQRAEHDWQRQRGALLASKEVLARQYGGVEWMRLSALLGAMLSLAGPSTP